MAGLGLLFQLAAGLLAGGRLGGPARLRPHPTMVATATRTSVEPQLASATAASLPLRIDGQWYDVSAWADAHPGGRWLLEYARGRDVTALFHSIHLRNEAVASAALSKLPIFDATQLQLPSSAGLPPSVLESEGALQGEYVFSFDEQSPPAAPPLPPIDSELRSELRALLQREFRDMGAAKATAWHWARTLLAAVGTIACWAGWLGGSIGATALLPLVHWVLIAHTVNI